jgi:hypothetical protein
MIYLQEDLAKFGYKLNTKAKTFVTHRSLFGLSTYYFKHILEICRFFLNFEQHLAIENLKEWLFLALVVFTITFWVGYNI